MFDYTTLNTTVETVTANAEKAVNTAINTSEDNTKKMISYMQDSNFRILAESYADAGFAVVRAVADAGKTVAETAKKTFTV